MTEQQTGGGVRPDFSTQIKISSLEEKNRRLVRALENARDKIKDLSLQIESLSKPPLSYATVVRAEDGRSATDSITVSSGGKLMDVSVASGYQNEAIEPGQDVLLNQQLVVVGGTDQPKVGEIVSVKLVLDSERVLVKVHADDERVLRISAKAKAQGVRVGDMMLADLRSGFVLEQVERPDVEHLLLEEVPDVAYSDIGGLDAQIDQIQDSVELPFEQPELYRSYGLKPPKGVLLYGPPGCGKTLIAKAVATSLAGKIAKKTGEGAAQRSYFLNVKGPQLLDKYVGETERQIREIFARARDRAAHGIPVVIFFDEMEALFRARGSGISSDVETTVVPQLLAEIDGVESLDNVIVIGASNREDMIDPAILRPGRLDIKIRIERPTLSGAVDILLKYLTPELPINARELERYGSKKLAVEAMAGAVAQALYARTPEREYLDVTYTDGGRETLYVSDFVSGAMLAAIVDRAKKLAIKDYLAGGEQGITLHHLYEGATAEIRENEDVANIANPQEWARINGRARNRSVAMISPLNQGVSIGDEERTGE